MRRGPLDACSVRLAPEAIEVRIDGMDHKLDPAREKRESSRLCCREVAIAQKLDHRLLEL